jgi:proline iminopeptidase
MIKALCVFSLFIILILVVFMMIFKPRHVIPWPKATSKFMVHQPFHEGYLQVSAPHRLWYAEYGNPNGAAVLVLHGGPGAGCSPHDLTFFDLTYWRVILLDQRGAGHSLPFTELKENTTKDLIDDIECLRAHLKIERWTMFGGSWGSALALAYGEVHPNRVNGFILRGIFLARTEEAKQIWWGMSTLFPDVWQEMVDFLPKEEQKNLERSFYQRILNPERHIALPAARALMKYDLTCAYLTVQPAALNDMLDNEVLVLGVARLFSHYASNHFFLQSNQLLDNIDKINHLPLIIVNGRYDVITPPQTAFLLHTKWPGSILHLVDAAGHSALEPPIAAALSKATEEIKPLLKKA